MSNAHTSLAAGIPGTPPEILPIDSITVDPEIQQRAGMDADLVAEYEADIATWINLAPIVVFADGSTRWVADGFHRLAAASAVDIDQIPAFVRQGSRLDAVRFALGANAEHGKRRTAHDLRRGYCTIVAYGFCDPEDNDAIASTLKCSIRWASELNREAREYLKSERDATIQKLAEEGRTQQEIAATVGVGQATVHRTLDYSKRTAFRNESSPQSSIPEVPLDDGPDWGWPEGASVEPPEAAPARPTAPAKAPAPQPAAEVGAKGPTSWDAGQVALKVGRVLSALYQLDSALEYEPDGRALLANLRYALDRYADKFADKEPQADDMEGNGHA